MQDAELYHQNNGLQTQDAAAFLEHYTKEINVKTTNNKVLDIGSGDGSITPILKKYIPHMLLTGCDKSENMVNFANKKHRDSKTFFVVLDIEGDIPENLKCNFGHIFSFNTFHWVMNQRIAFKNVFNLLDHDGNCLLTIMAWSPFYESFRFLAQSDKWSLWLHDVENYISPYHDLQDPEKEVTKIMESIGFIDINVTCKNMLYIYEDEKAMERALAAIIPFKIPKEKFNAFTYDALKRMQEVLRLNNFTDETELSHFHYKTLIVRGHKPAAELD